MAQVRGGADGLPELSAPVGSRFARSEPREHAMAYIQAGVGGGTEELLDAVRAGRGRHPNGMQRSPSTTDWDPNLVRDDLQRPWCGTWVIRVGVLIIDLCRPWNYADHRSGGLAGSASQVHRSA